MTFHSHFQATLSVDFDDSTSVIS